MKNLYRNTLLILIGLFAIPTIAGVRNDTNAQRSVTIELPNLQTDVDPLEMILIPSGTFQMGSPDSDRDRYEDETPPHSVSIGNDFYLGKYEITQAQWQAVMGENPSQFPTGPNAPVENVSWNDCQAFIDKLNAMGQGRFRLPTEAEWEYACRAGTESRFYWGDEPLECDPLDREIADSTSSAEMKPNEVRVTDDRYATVDLSNRIDVDSPNNRELTVRWNLEEKDLKDVHVYVQLDDTNKKVYLGRTANGAETMYRWKAGSARFIDDTFQEGPQSGHEYRFFVYGLPSSPSGAIVGPYACAGPVTYKTKAVSAPKANPLGLENLSWNVWEWCMDAYDPDFYKRSPDADPLNERNGQFRVCRGGSRYNSATFQRCAARGKADPDSRYYYIGLRIAMEK